MAELTAEIDHVVSALWEGLNCRVTVEAWDAARAWERASRMVDVRWGPCLQTPRGSWRIAGEVPLVAL